MGPAPGTEGGELSGLVVRARGGDRGAFEKIVAITARVVYAQVVASVRDRQRAEDLTQETFVAAWKGIGTVESPGGFVGWLLVLARNRVADAAKFEGRKKRGSGGVAKGEVGEVADRGHGPAEAAELVEARERAMRVLEELPEEYRRVLAMRYLAGADYVTIRRALEISDGALRGMLNRGMALMRERLTKLER